MSGPALTAADKFFLRDCVFVAGANNAAALPPPAQQEVAFIGRSNVGKSSLVNALTGRKTLARASSEPGRTRQLNFFLLAGQLMLVDLPGYGYAKASKQEIEGWTKLCRNYLRGRPNLRRICLLIDARRGIGEGDEEMMTMLDDAAVAYQLVLTKTDKVAKNELPILLEKTQQIIARHVAAVPLVFPTSAETKEGISTLRADLASLAGIA